MDYGFIRILKTEIELKKSKNQIMDNLHTLQEIVNSPN